MWWYKYNHKKLTLMLLSVLFYCQVTVVYTAPIIPSFV
jgi:hypothetical protein